MEVSRGFPIPWLLWGELQRGAGSKRSPHYQGCCRACSQVNRLPGSFSIRCWIKSLAGTEHGAALSAFVHPFLWVL